MSPLAKTEEAIIDFIEEKSNNIDDKISEIYNNNLRNRQKKGKAKHP